MQKNKKGNNMNYINIQILMMYLKELQKLKEAKDTLEKFNVKVEIPREASEMVKYILKDVSYNRVFSAKGQLQLKQIKKSNPIKIIDLIEVLKYEIEFQKNNKNTKTQNVFEFFKQPPANSTNINEELADIVLHIFKNKF